MRIDPGLLIIILFIVAPLLERLLKAGKQQQKPPEQRPTAPRRRVPPPLPRPEQQPTSRAETESEEETAAGMLPDDLWAILTGQLPAERPRPEPPRAPPPQPPVPKPQPAQARTPKPAPVRTAKPAPVRTPARQPMAARRFPEGGRSFELPVDEETQVRRTPPAASYPVEGYVREIPTYSAPEIVSLEDLDIDEEARHKRFHQLVVDASTPATVNRPARHELVNLLRQPAGVRRAMVLREVLGPPKGLE